MHHLQKISHIITYAVSWKNNSIHPRKGETSC
nr:MAG TPA: hypothetical protein [Caudoviricetes sp.]